MSTDVLQDKLKAIITSRDWVDNIDYEGGWTPLVCSMCGLPFHGWKLKTKCMHCSVPIFPTHVRHITHSAVLFEGKVYSLLAPHRHHHVLRDIHKAHKRTVPNKQGFLDNQGKFLNREEAFFIAVSAGQILDLTLTRGDHLYSEDLW